MKRVMIIGGAGAGKSTLARRLGAITGLPIIHIDPMYWRAGWQQRPAEETIRLAREAAAGEAWIFEGNNSASMPDRIARADTLVFLDVGTVRRLWRLIRRSVTYWGRTRPDMADGCPERLDLGFLKWAAGYHHDGRVRALRLLKNVPSHVRVCHLSDNAQIEAFLVEADLPVVEAPRQASPVD